RCAALRGDDQEVLAVAAVDQRVLAGLAGLAADGLQHQDAGAVPIVADLAAGRLVLAHVLVTEQTVVGHARRLPRREPPDYPTAAISDQPSALSFQLGDSNEGLADR